MTEDLNKQNDTLFHPESIAIVGVPRGMKTGKLFLLALLDQGFPGKIYPVHPKADEIDGLKAYPDVKSIPGPVDLVIILVPQHLSLDIIKDCAAKKGVKGAVLFTAGYKETGTEEGRELEKEIVRVARAAGMRLIGPNCMGLYSPESGISFFPNLPREPGKVGLISHSGSLANILARTATAKGIRFSKAVSLGNECDLKAADFLSYLGQDPNTGVIGAYLEGIQKGPFFLEALRKASINKPVILWKIGSTPEGSDAAASHTGALAGSWGIWEGVARQGGATRVAGYEAWTDALMGFSLLPPELGDRLAVISGPGGLAVASAEAIGRAGLKLAELTEDTKAALSKVVPPTGTSLRNPVDVGLTASLDMDIYIQSVRCTAQDENVDSMVIVGIGLDPEANRKFVAAMIEARQEFGKPFIMINVPGFDPALAGNYCQAGLPAFDSAERAMTTYAHIRSYQKWREAHK